MTIRLSNKQKSAIDKLKAWFLNRTDQQQVLSVLGYAGTGKSTIVKYALADLGIDAHQAGGSAGFLTATFTGKAALVMTRKGTPAQTIHSLIYRVSDTSPQEIERIKSEIAALNARISNLGSAERLFVESQLRSLELRLRDAHRPQFVLNAESILREAKLLVLDEVSMVGRDMAKDLLAFGKPVLVLGDPGQLPPIRGEGAFNSDTPDVLLTEVHRQAAESAIIRLATAARQGNPIAMASTMSSCGRCGEATSEYAVCSMPTRCCAARMQRASGSTTRGRRHAASTIIIRPEVAKRSSVSRTATISASSMACFSN